MLSHLEGQTHTDEPISEPDRRRYLRHPGRALAEVVRDSDPLRHVLRVELLDVSMAGVGILVGTKLNHQERVRVRLRNVVQRFLKEVRGIVRWTETTPDGKFRVGVELNTPFSAVDMQMLKRAGIGTSGDSKRTWV
ncbi:MAG TPA: PilZ domain-containing protein [Planctomycetaceae bacterium]|nr:PilZ domain-containing protein [Planctomycetaceae bacterium]